MRQFPNNAENLQRYQ